MNEITRKMKLLISSLLFMVSGFLSVPASADNKVVVIPLGADAAKPFAPLSTNSPASSQYTIASGTVTDKRTGLIWQQQDSTTKYSWDSALTYCADLTLDNKNSWRLPDIYELQSIVNYSNSSPSITDTAFSSTESEAGYWSATSTAYGFDTAWSISFFAGGIGISGKSLSYYARCVR